LAVLRKPWDESTREEIENRQNVIVNNAAQYCSVVRTGIGNTRMVLGGEVDASMSILSPMTQSIVSTDIVKSGIANHHKKEHP
jgi:hypothetical protein